MNQIRIHFFYLIYCLEDLHKSFRKSLNFFKNLKHRSLNLLSGNDIKNIFLGIFARTHLSRYYEIFKIPNSFQSINQIERIIADSTHIRREGSYETNFHLIY